MEKPIFQLEPSIPAAEKLPLLFPALFFSTGIILANDIKKIPQELFTFLCVDIFVLFFLRKYKHYRALLYLAFSFSGIFLGTAHHYLPPNDISLLADSSRAKIIGKIISLPEEKWNGKKHIVSFVLQSEEIKIFGTHKKVRGKVQVTLMNPIKKINPGERIQLTGVFSEPKARTNPGEFDYRNYLSKMNIKKTMFAIGPWAIKILEQPKPSVMTRIHLIRSEIASQMNRLFSYPENSLACAILLGIRKNIPNWVRDQFAKTGTAHLLAISGLNITLLSGLFYLFLKRMRLFGRLGNAALTLALTIFYIFIAGANPPVIRAGIMASIFLIGIILGREGNFINSLLVAFFILIMIDSQYLFNPSFQLSFTAVFALSLLSVCNENAADLPLHLKAFQIVQVWISRDLYATFATFFALLPIIAYYFNTISPIVFIANLVASPLMLLANVMTLLLLPAHLISPDFAHLLAKLPSFCFKLVMYSLGKLSQIPMGHWYVKTPFLYQIISYYAGLLLFVCMRKKQVFKGIAIFFISISIFPFLFAKKSQLEITFLDLGKQNALYFQTDQKINGFISLDGGRLNHLARWTIRPFLISQGINSIEHLLIQSAYKKPPKWKNEISSDFKVKNITSIGDNKIVTKKFKTEPIYGSLRNHHRNIAGLFLKMKNYKIFYLQKTPDVTSLSNDKKETDILYISEIFMNEKDLNALIDELSPKFVVINDRQCSQFMVSQIKKFVSSDVFLLSETGAITFKSVENAIKAFPYKNP